MLKMYCITLGSLLFLALCSYSTCAVIPLLPASIPPVKQEGSSIELVCGIDPREVDRQKIVEAFWTKTEDSFLVKLEKLTGRLNIDIVDTEEAYKNILTINNLQKSDAGQYICHVIRKEGGDTYYFVNLEIEPKSV